jgi:hypothetical protein
MGAIEEVSGIAQQFLDLVRKFAPHSWVGNIEPGGPHFTSVDKMDTGVNLDKQRIWVSVLFTDQGIQHKLQMSQSISHFGQKNAATDLEFDHVQRSGAGFVISNRVGLFGLHLIATWKFTSDDTGKEARYRFDGAVV